VGPLECQEPKFAPAYPDQRLSYLNAPEYLPDAVSFINIVFGVDMRRQKEWWQDFFARDFRPVFDILPRKRTNEHIRYIIRKLNLRPGKTLLDCPCGIGRISIPLAQKGIKVTAVDITQSYLDELERKAFKKGLKIMTLRADMRRIPFHNQFDAAVNLWTSFGFFEDDRQDLRAIRRMFRALKPGGRFLMHIVNRDWIISHFEQRDWMKCGDVLSFEKRKFDYARSICQSEWSFIKHGATHTHQVAIRMYSYHELIEMFNQAGFVNVFGFGSVKDEPIDR